MKRHGHVRHLCVTLTDGSGIVHIAPAFGEDDANAGVKIRASVRAACKAGRHDERGNQMVECICEKSGQADH